MGIQELWLFIVAGLLLIITPGPDMALIIARSSQYGVRAGMAAALGIGAGCFIHTAAAAVGFSAILTASALAFTVLKWVGAAYLVYLGLHMIWSSFQEAATGLQTNDSPRGDLRGIFLQGLLSNALNPKVALFFLAFLPQFISAEASSKFSAFLLLGFLFALMGTTWNLAVAWAAGQMAASAGFVRLRAWLDRTMGVLFVALGIRLAWSERP
jgi:threonine/homoserine/homoserine lactone efflux protein